jgi:microcystin-dependent protein
MTPFLGQLLLASWNYASTGYYLCNGQLLAINQFQALFSLLGTTFGGNGIQNFALPNLQGRTPLGFNNQLPMGVFAGEDFHTLISTEVPSHTHQLKAATSGTTLTKPAGNLLGGGGAAIYAPSGNSVAMNPGTLANSGGGGHHENRQPFLVMNWCIAYTGIFPSRN